MNSPSTRWAAAAFVAAFAATLIASCAGTAAEPRAAPVQHAATGDAAVASSDARGEPDDDEWIEEAFEHEGYCLPGEGELCGCPGAASGTRRCNAEGTAFGPCDACASVVSCGSTRCEIVRVDALALSIAPCCPAGHPNRCGVDVSHFVKLHGYSAGCLELDAPGTPDPTCPTLSLPMPGKGEVPLQGCRTPSGACGFDVDVPGAINLGCTLRPARSPNG